MSEKYRCPNGHEWEDTWGDDVSLSSGQVTCPVCGSRISITRPPEMVQTAKFSVASRPPPDQAPTTAPTWPAPGSAVPEKVIVPGYEILGELGRGGMGVVYKARQKGLKRVVALKMVLAGAHASAESLARFRGEAEVVARLQHPNIVQIYEIGEQDGRPFFSMEFVDGGSLQGKTGGNPQPLREAAQVVATVARGIHAAHELNIVHRDLKPANVLLARDGTPKVTDFGLAKQLGEESQLSQTGDVMGTPSYMAPEQAAGRIKAIGPASDVYALGAILYELLTGRPPFKSETAMDTLLQVLYADPVPPSHLRAKTPRDLETICLKCLEKDPDRRYPSAVALANDLQRYLDDKPILARPVGNVTRTLKWFRRHPGVAGMMAVVVLLVLSVIGVSAWYNVDLTRLNQQLEVAKADAVSERDKALAAEKEALNQKGIAEGQRALAVTRRDQAEARFQDAMNAVRAMLTEVGNNDLLNTKMMEGVRQNLLLKALHFQKKFLDEKTDDPAVQHQVGQAYQLVGDIQTMLGNYPEAATNYQKGIDLLGGLEKSYPREPAYQRDLAACYFQRGRLLQFQDQMSAAGDDYRRAEKLQQKVSDAVPNPEYLQQLARTYNDLGLVLRKGNDLKQAEEKYRAALEIQEKLVKDDPKAKSFLDDLAGTHNDLAIVLSRRKKPDEAARDRDLNLAVKEYDTAEELINALVAASPGVTEYRRKKAALHNNRGNVRRELGKPDEALKDLDLSVKLGEFRADSPLVPAYQHGLANALNSRGLLFGRRDAKDTWDRALAEYQRAEDLLRVIIDKNEEVAAYQSTLGATLDNRADVFYLQNKLKEARSQLDMALRYHQAARAINDREPAYRLALRNHYVKLANVLLRSNKDIMSDPAGAAAAAKQLPALAPKEADEYVLAARLLSRCMAEAEKKKPPDQTGHAYGEEALKLLRQGMELGYANVPILKTNADFDAVRKAREKDFDELVEKAMKNAAPK